MVAVGYGGPEQLEVRPLELDGPGPDEVLVEVRATGVNAWDLTSYSGTVGDDPDDLPVRLGGECAGVVLAGALPAGAEVVVHPVGRAYADRVVVAASSCLPKPTALSFEEAAGLMLTGTAAAHLVHATGVTEGDTVLLHGAAGGVGLYAAQLARERGARLLGTALPEHHDLLRELGVEPCDFRTDVAGWVRSQCPDGVDAVLDAVGTPTVLDLSLAVARDPARVATLVPSPAAGARGDPARVRRGRRPGHVGARRRAARPARGRRGGLAAGGARRDVPARPRRRRAPRDGRPPRPRQDRARALGA